MSVIGEQIKKYRGIRGMTQQEIADALGESSGRVIYNWEKGIGRPDCDKLAKLCDLLGVSADELIGCRSKSERPTAAEWETIKKYRGLDEHGKEIVDYLIDSEYRRVSATGRKAKCRMLRMDYYTLPASAGTGNILDSELAEEILVPESKEAEKADFVISVGGDSMDVGEIGIFVVNGDVFIKERGNGCLISHNEKYKPIRISEHDSVFCCGRVVGIMQG